MKPFKTIDEQYRLLVSRGLIIQDEKEVRNAIAHNNNIFSFSSRNNYPFLHRLNGGYVGTASSVYATYSMLKYFLSNDQLASTERSIKKTYKLLKRDIKTIDADDIICSLGYPTNY